MPHQLPSVSTPKNHRSAIAAAILCKTQPRIFLILVAIATSSFATACQKTSSILEPNKIAEITKPATVLISTQHNAEISLGKPELDQEKVQQLQREVVEKVAKGEINNNSADIYDYVLQTMIENLNRYLKPGETLRDKVEINSTGTGVMVADGYVATADHVVANDSPQVKRQITRTALQEIITSTCKEVIRGTRNSSTRLNLDRLQESCVDSMAEYGTKNLKIEEIKTDVSVWMQPAQPSPGNPGKRIPAEVLKAGESRPGKDAALLKIAGENYPTVTLGDNKSINVGDPSYSNGFPGTVNRLFSQSKQGITLPEATFNSGTISARRTVDGGEVFQTNVPIQRGNSGGGIYDNKGQVIGVVSFASTDEDGKPVPGSNFLTPISVIQQQLKEAGVTPQLTPITERYQNAIDLLQQTKARKALKEFQEIRNLNPDFPYIQTKISEAQKRVPEDRSLPDWAYLLLAILVLGGGGGYFWTRRNAKLEDGFTPNIVAQLNELFHRSGKSTPSVTADDRTSDNR
jgi:serine protease Do